MKQYLDQLQFVLENGEKKSDRTGTGTISVFAPPPAIYDMREFFPIVTTKKMYWKGIAHELLWFLKGDTNIRHLVDNGVNIWNDDAFRWHKEQTGENISKEEFLNKAGELHPDIMHIYGDLGPIYGAQWRKCKKYYTTKPYESLTIDQIKNLISSLLENPNSRRHIINSWNVADLQDMALPPCHCLAQFYVNSNNELSCQMYQRSADMFLGIPFNISSYALLVYIIAHLTGLKPGRFVHVLGDAHIYLPHVDQVKEQLSRTPYEPSAKLHISNRVDNINDIEYDDIILENYQSHSGIKAPLIT